MNPAGAPSGDEERGPAPVVALRAFWFASLIAACAIFGLALATHIGAGTDLLGRVASPVVSDRRAFTIARASVGDDAVLHVDGRLAQLELRGMRWYVNGSLTEAQRLALDGDRFSADIPLWSNRDVNRVYAYALLGHQRIVAMAEPIEIRAARPIETVAPAVLARETAGARAMAGSLDQARGDTVVQLAGLHQVPLHGSPRLGVIGWAADLSEHVVPRRVEAVLDGRLAVAATVGQPREDVAKALRDRAYADSGYTAVFPSTVWTHGLHHVEVRAFDARGRYAPIGAGFDVMVGG